MAVNFDEIEYPEGWDGTVQIEEIEEDYSDIFDKKKPEDNSDGDGDGEDTDDTDDGTEDEDSDEIKQSAGDGDISDGDGDDEDGDDGGDEGDAIELELVENPDEALVSAVESLLLADQLHLEDDQIKEIFDGTQESYDKLMVANKDASENMAIQNIYDKLPERGKDFFNYLVKTEFKGDLDGWLKLEREVTDVLQFDSSNLTDEQAKQVIEEDNRSKGLSDRKSKIIIEALEDDDAHIDEAKAILKDKKAEFDKQKADKLVLDEKNARETKVLQEQYYNNVVKEIQGTKFAKTKQEEIYNLIYNVNQQTGNTALVDKIAKIIQSNPKQLVQLAQVFDGYSEKDGFDFKRLKKQVKSETSSKTKREIRRKNKQGLKGSETRRTDNNRKQSLDDWLDGADL